MANIMQVARLAGVSHQTVSRVLNDEDTVRPETRARVEAAIKELRYRPSSVARALATRKTRTIGLISTGNPLYGPASTALAFNEAARESGYQVTTASMGSADRAMILTAVDVLLRQQVEAVVLIATDYSSIEAVDGLEIDIPLVTADSSGHGSFPTVSIDQYHGASIATAHLADLGHRVILHLAGPLDSLDASERERAWRAELTRRALPVHEPLHGDWTADGGRLLGEQLIAATGFSVAPRARSGSGSGGSGSGSGSGSGVPLSAAPPSAVSPASVPFTAVFVANDQMALGLMHAFSDHGIRVPEDVSIVGFDDIPEAAHFTPPLTTVSQDFTELGRRMMGAVAAVLDGREVSHPITTLPHLVLRSSAAPASR